MKTSEKQALLKAYLEKKKAEIATTSATGGAGRSKKRSDQEDPPQSVEEVYKRYTIFIRSALVARMKEIARKKGILLKSAFEQAIEDYVRKNNK